MKTQSLGALLGQQEVMPLWRAASYARLSVDDGEAGTSGSIVNQQRIIDDYASRSSDIVIVDHYVDDGWSGSSFERPDFQRLMGDVDRGKVNCILVKDLSRFGRNYLETGRYLERVFPAKGVRLIAIQDSYDGLDVLSNNPYETFSDSALLVPFKNLINDYYCATTSMKTKSALAARRRAGLYVGSLAPYGYLKDPDDKSRLIEDPEAAPIVRLVFEMRAEGCTLGAIANHLNEIGVRTPGQLREMRKAKGNSAPAAETRAARGLETRGDEELALGPTGTNGSTGARASGGKMTPAERVRLLLDAQSGGRDWSKAEWQPTQVRRILDERSYTGTLVQGKTFRPSFRQQYRFKTPQQMVVRVEGACPTLVDAGLFAFVHAIEQTALMKGGRGADNPLRGLVHCQLCGERMALRSTSAAGKRYSYYRCTNGCHVSVHSEEVHDVVCQLLGSLERAFVLKAVERVCVGAGGGIDVQLREPQREVAS